MLRRLVAAITAVMLWQAAFVAPQPVAASDPTIDCGMGFVCAPSEGGGNGVIVPPSGPLQVSGVDHDVIQDTATDPSDPSYVPPAVAWGFIEAEAMANIAAIHQVDRDIRINKYARDEVRGYIMGRLLNIVQKPANQRTAQEQTAYNTLQHLVWKAQQRTAQNAIDEYNRWNGNKCGYGYPPPLQGTTPSYYESVQGECTNADPNVTVDPPTAEQFEAIGTAMEYKDLSALPADKQAVINTAATFFGGLGAAAVAGAIAGAIIDLFPAVSSLFVTGGALVLFPYAAIVTGTSSAVAAASGVGGFTAAMGVGSAIAIIIAAVVVTAIGTWHFVENAQVPDKLDDFKDSFASAPDLGSLMGTDDGKTELSAVITRATLPDYPSGDTTPAPAASDSKFDDQTCNPTCGSPSTVDSITFTNDDGNHTMYITNGWLSVDNKYSLLFKFHDWNGNTVLGGIAGSKFITVNPGDLTASQESSSISYMDGAVKHTATIDPKTPPIVKPTVTGFAQEGQQLTFHANATPGKAGDTVAIQWLVENPFGQKYDTQILPGLSVLQGCYTGPVSATAQGITVSCPWDKYSGDSFQYTYTKWGAWHVRAIATESNGAMSSQVFQVNVEDASPGFVANSVSEQVSGTDEGSATVDLTGQVNDIGDDPLAVVVDWGDGTTDTQFFPCDWTAVPSQILQGGVYVVVFPPNFCIGNALDDQLRVKPAAHPTSFSLQHTYMTPSGGTPFQPTLLVKDDGNFFNSMALGSVAVANVTPVAGVVCALPVPLPDGYFNLNGCEQRSGDTSYSVPVSGSFYDPGADGPWTMDVNWGDGSVSHFVYPCPNGAPCPFTLTPTYQGVFGTTPYVFWTVNHTYAAAGHYPIGFTISDQEGATASPSTAADISAPPDHTNPTIDLTTPGDGATYTVGQVVNADFTCHDNVAVSTCTGTSSNGSPIDTSTPGAHAFTVNATDTSSNTATKTVHYNVVYPFNFVGPIQAPPTFNQLTAGQKLRIQFSLGGKQVKPVTRAHARHAKTDCSTAERTGRWIAGGLSKIGYLYKSKTFYVVWQTTAAMAGTCQTVQIRFADGTQENLLFHLT